MATIDDLLSMYSSPETTPQAKKRNVELASAEKLKALSGITPKTFTDTAIATQGNNQGEYSANPIESDLRQLSDYELRDKYGSEAELLIRERALGSINVGTKRNFADSGTGAVGTAQDTVVATGHGLAGLLGGIAYLGTAGVDALAGTTASNTVAEANKSVLDWINSGHTDVNQIDTEINRQQGELNRRDTRQLYDERVAENETSKVDAFLRRIGQDFVDEVGNTGSSPEQLTNLTGEAIGSIGGIGALTKAGTKVGTKALEALTAKGVVKEGSKTVAALEKYGKEAFTAAMIGITEGGSVGAEAANRVLNTDITKLVNDPVHGKRIAALIAAVGEDEAKEILAREVGSTVAGETGLIATILGKGVSKFEGNALARVTPKQAYKNLVAQSIEETLQEGSGQLISNYEIQNQINSKQDIGEDVGSNAAKGFLGGALGTAAFNPAVMTQPITAPAKIAAKYLDDKTAEAFKDTIAKVNTGVLSNIAKDSPISNERVVKAAQTITETVAPTQEIVQAIKDNPESTEGSLKAADYVNNLTEALKFEAPPVGALPPIFDEELAGVTTTVEAAHKLAALVDRKDISEEDRFLAIENLHGLMLGVSNSLLDGAEDALDEMENLPELKQYADNFTGLFNSFKDSPAMQAVMPHFDTILQVGVNLGHYKEINVDNLEDPAEQANLDRILKVASTTTTAIPESVANQLNAISDMIDTGNTPKLTPAQVNQIRGLSLEMRVAAAISAQAAEMGLEKLDIVNRQVSLDDAEERSFKYPSAREHARGITAAIAKGDLVLAKERLDELRNFAVHFSNKVSALNKHIATAVTGTRSTVKYWAYRSKLGEEWSESKKGVYVNFNKESSVELAKTVGLEALALGNIYNQLVNAYPELEAKKVKVSIINKAVTNGKSLAEVRAELLGETSKTPKPTKTATSRSESNYPKWLAVLNKYKGIGNLNKVKGNLTEEEATEVIEGLKELPSDFKTVSANQKDFNELKLYFGIGSKSDEDTNTDTDTNNSSETPPTDEEENQKSSTGGKSFEKRWAGLLTFFKGIKRLNESKERLSAKLAEGVFDVLKSMPDDFTMDGKYQQDFEEVKEYFLGEGNTTNSSEQTPVEEAEQQQGETTPTPTPKPNSTDAELAYKKGDLAIQEGKPIKLTNLLQGTTKENTSINTTEEVPTKSTAAVPYTWGREAENAYEISDEGDAGFSSLTATLKDGRTIEEAYQLDVKGYRKEGDSWKLGIGKFSLITLTKQEAWEAYKALWSQWAYENPKKMQALAEAAKGKTLTDPIAITPINPAKALADILNQNPNGKFKAPKKYTRKLVVDTTPTETPQDAIEVTTDNLLSPDYITSIEIAEGTFDSVMQAVTVLMFRYVKKTPANRAVMEEALETTDPDKLREIQGKYTQKYKSFDDMIANEMVKVVQSYANSHPEVMAYLTENQNNTFSFPDQNNFWKPKLSAAYAEIVEDIKAIEQLPISEPVNEKPSLKTLFTELLFGKKNKFLEVFSLGSKNVNNLLNQTSPLSYIINKLSDLVAEDSPFKNQAKQAWRGALVAQVPSIVSTLNSSVQDFMDNRLKLSKRTLIGTIAKMAINALSTTDVDEVIATALKKAGITENDLDAIKQYTLDESTLKAMPKLIKELEDTKEKLRTKWAKRQIKPKQIAQVLGLLDSKLASYAKDLAAAEARIKASNVEKKLNTLRDILIENQKDISPEVMAEYREMVRTPAGKLLSIVENTPEGFAINQRIAEVLAIAGMSWMANTSNKEDYIDAEKAAKILGINEHEVSKKELRILNNGQHSAIVIQELANTIRDFLNIKSTNTAMIGDTDGFVLSLASNVLDALVKEGLVTVEKLSLYSEGVHTDHNYFTATATKGTIYRQVPEVLEEAVLEEPNKKKQYFVGSPTQMKVAKNVSHSPVPLTQEQQDMLETSQQVPNYINTPILDFFNAAGTEGLVYLFANGELDEENMHPLDYLAKSGKNASISNAWERAKTIIGDVAHKAINWGTKAENIAIYFSKGVTSVARLQYGDPYNMQSSKVVRPLIVATKKKVDLTKPDEEINFLIGIAQGMGIKIHNLYDTNAVSKLQNILGSEEVQAVFALLDEKKEKFSSEDLEVLKKVMPLVDNTEWGLTNLVEYHRFKRATPLQLKSFEHAVATEADGVTNGSANGLHVIPKEVTENLIKLWRMTGFFIGNEPRTLNEEREENPTDIYLSVAKVGTAKIAELFAKVKANIDPADAIVVDDVFSLMKLFNVTLKIAENGNIELTRPSAKNPVTVTLYGAGVSGISDKILGEILKEVYSEISLKIQGKGKLTDPTIHAEVQRILSNLGRFTIKKLSNKKKEDPYLYVLEEVPAGNIALPAFDAPKEVWKSFEVSSTAFKTISSSVTAAYTEGLADAIFSVVGVEMQSGVDSMITSSNLQAKIIKSYYHKRIEDVITEKLQTDPLYRRSDYLSKQELESIRKETMERFGGIYSNIHQNSTVFLTNLKSSLNGLPYTGASLTDTNQAFPELTDFGDPGVSIAPNMIIRTDGLAIQHLINDPENNMNMLYIFDGIMMNTSDIKKGSALANKAVFRTWTEQTPLRLMADSFKQVLKNVDVENLDPDTAMQLLSYYEEELANTALTPANTINEKILGTLTSISNDLEISAIKAESLQELVKALPSYTDQMAGVGSPYHNKGTITEEEIEKGIAGRDLVTFLKEKHQAIYQEKLDKFFGSEKKEVPNVPAEPITSLSPAFIEKVKVYGDSLPKAARNAFEAVVAAFKQSEYLIIVGDYTKVAAELAKLGLKQSADYAKNSKDSKAFVHYKERVIVAAKDSGNTLLHEMIHASVAHGLAEGLSDKPATTAAEKRAKQATAQLKILLDEFLSDEFIFNFKPNSLGEATYLKVKALLTTKYAGDTFKQINEMLAYTLPDEDMYDALTYARTKASIPAKFLEGIKKAISYFFGSATLAESTSFYANLVFHSATLAHDNNSFNTQSTVTGASDYTEENSRLLNLTERLKGLIKKDFQNSSSVVRADKHLKLVQQIKEMEQVYGAGFKLNQEETDAYIALTLATRLGLNANSSAVIQLQEVFSKVASTIKVEDFYPNDKPTKLEKEVALDKFDAVFGKYNHGRKVHEDILSNFIALASVSEELQKIIGKALVEKHELSVESLDAFDTFVGNIGDKITSNITVYAGNSKVKPSDPTGYFNALVEVLFTANENRVVKENTSVQYVGAKADALNNWMADSIQKGSTALNKATEPLRKSSNKLVKTVGNITQIINAIVNKDIAQVAALDINRNFNRVEGFQELRDLMRDLIGRTKDNALVFDLVKPIKFSVDKLRQNYKNQVPIAIKQQFKTPLTKMELTSLGISLGKTGINVLGSGMVSQLAVGKLDANEQIRILEDKLKAIDPTYFKEVAAKAKQLANYNINGIAGDMLLRNPEAIARQFTRNLPNKPKIDKAYVNKVALLISLYSYDLLSQQDKDILASIAERDPEALTFVSRFISAVQEEDLFSAEVNLDAKANMYFGYTPKIATKEGSLIVAADTEYAELISKGYTRVSSYVGDPRDPLHKTSRSYYYNPIDLGLEYRQGILQNIQGSVAGVDLETGLSLSRFHAGIISDPKEVARILKTSYKPSNTGEELLPVLNKSGQVIAFERTMSHKQIESMQPNTDISELLGIMRGRQIEEASSRMFLTTVAEALKTTYDNDPDKTQYIDLFDEKALAKDKVLAYGVGLLSFAAKEEIRRVFGDSFYVKREMLTEVIGFRKASVTDIFTGVSRLNPETITTLRNVVMSVFGREAYKYLAYSEKYLQEGVSFVKSNIVVKSVVVPAANIVSNALHLLSLGIPLAYTVNQIPKKVAELEYYMKVSRKLIELEVKIAAAANKDNRLVDRLYAEKKSIEGAIAKLSIAPLINAGELSNINDVGFTNEDNLLFSGKLKEYFDTLVTKTPSGVKAVGRHLLITKDTALYEGLQKSVLYGDFIAKSVQYDYLTKVKKVNSKEAITTVSAEFISYDHLPGRGRDYLESIGLLWFYNYKLRSVKIALNTIRNNPLYALLYAGFVGSTLGIDSPIDSNVVSQVFDGSVGYSVGVGMGLEGIFANPYVQLIS